MLIGLETAPTNIYQAEIMSTVNYYITASKSQCIMCIFCFCAYILFDGSSYLVNFGFSWQEDLDSWGGGM